MKAYFRAHQTESLKKIRDAMGKECNEICFNPLINGDQWIECLFWFRDALWKCNRYDSEYVCSTIDDAIVSRESLMVEILEFLSSRSN